VEGVSITADTICCPLIVPFEVRTTPVTSVIHIPKCLMHFGVATEDDVTFDLGSCSLQCSSRLVTSKDTCTYNTRTSSTVSSALTISRSSHARLEYCSPVVARTSARTCSTHARTLSPHCFPEWARSESFFRNSGSVVSPLHYNVLDKGSEGHSDLSKGLTCWALHVRPLRPLGSSHWVLWFQGRQ
jgi:hypothetical protein